MSATSQEEKQIQFVRHTLWPAANSDSMNSSGFLVEILTQNPLGWKNNNSFTKSDYTEIAVTPIIGKNPKGIAHSYNGFCWAEISLPKLAHLGKINKKCFVALFSASQPDKMSCPRTLIPCVQRGKPKGYLMTCRS